MKKKFLLLFTCFLSVNILFVMLNGCIGSSTSNTKCWYYSEASLMAMDNSDSLPHQPDNAGVHAKSFLLQLTLWNTATTCMLEHRMFSINPAFATTVNTPTKIFDSVSITSDNDFDASHPAGTDLKDIFGMNSWQKLSALHPGTNYLYLVKAPANPGTYTFTILLYNSSDNSQNLTASSSPVKLLL